jgi:antitoxin component YwqK of YwqJK toxin-antitoxin module
MVDAMPNGVVTTYRDDGSRLAEATYVHGVLHGPYRDYWSHGGVSLEGQYRNGLKVGEWRFYDHETGKLREVLQFVDGREVMNPRTFGRSESSE